MLSSTIQPTRITNVTEFEVPRDEKIQAISSLASSLASRSDGHPMDSRLAVILQPVRDAPGFVGGEWGRIVERPDTVLLLTDWSPAEALQDFRQSAAYSDYTANLADAALNEPVSCDVVFGRRSPRGSAGRPSIHKVFFPAPVSADVMDSVSMMSGICGDGGSWRTIKSGPNAPHVQAAKRERVWTGWLSAPAMAGWKPGLEQRDGVEMQVAIWIHYWMSPEKEIGGKSAETEPCTPGVHSPHISAWLEKLRAAGALFWSEEHWESFPIRKTSKLNEQTLDLDGNPLSIPETRNY